MSGATHFVGIGGAGMSSLAAVLLAEGEKVTGCDISPGPQMELLSTRGVRVWTGHSPEHLEGAARLIATTPAANSEEVLEAGRRGLPVVKRAELLGRLMDARRGIAVAGTAGKTTTSALLAAMLIESGADPTAVIGGVPAGWELGGRHGSGEWLVAEADEYDRSFLYLHPEVVVLTGIDMDHPDIYASIEDVEAAFRQFLAGARLGGRVLVDATSDRAVRVASESGLPVETYGYAGVDWTIRVVSREPGGMQLALEHRERSIGGLRTALAGEHNLRNITGAVMGAIAAGATEDGIRAALAGFGGVGRRFELKGEVNGVVVVDDYAHHPAKVAAALEGARSAYPHHELWVVFQPHTYSRTRALLPQFAEALRAADRVFLVDVYAAREPVDPEVSVEALARLIGPHAEYVGPLAGAEGTVAPRLQPGTLLLTMGAGDITLLGPRVLEELRKEGAE